MSVAVVEQQKVSVRQLTNRVLERETSQRVRFEWVPHAHQVMPILGDVDRVGMREVQWRVLGELRQNEGIRGIDG